jgi:glycosyltransferase involved in cell wall biosynthesis
VGVSDATCFQWPKEDGGLRVDQATHVTGKSATGARGTLDASSSQCLTTDKLTSYWLVHKQGAGRGGTLTMVRNKKVVVVLPAYNAEKTLKKTCAEIPFDVVDRAILSDDASSDMTAHIARDLGLDVVVHPRNLGYGGNQKTCYNAALEQGADIVIMLHPDYQYTPKLIPAMAHLIESGLFDVVLGSRILEGSATRHGMPLFKYVSNRILTFIQNVLMSSKISEYHTGYRAFSRKVLDEIPWEHNSNDFVFDNQILSQALFAGFRVGEISCPAKYFPEASSINFWRSVKYGFGCLLTAIQFPLCRWHLGQFRIFKSLRYRQHSD